MISQATDLQDAQDLTGSDLGSLGGLGRIRSMVRYTVGRPTPKNSATQLC
jgi:hypothetical protein